jgi:hypothetical protein
MRIPFAVWSGLLALAIYAGVVGLEYLNFGVLDPIWPTARLIGAIWLGLAVLAGLFGAVRRSMTQRPADLPPEVEREIRQHEH